MRPVILLTLLAAGCATKPSDPPVQPAPPVVPVAEKQAVPPPPKPSGPSIEERLRVPTNLREIENRANGFALATMAKYRAIPQGWSYRKVAKIVGSYGVEVSERQVLDSTFTIIQWAGVAPGSYLQITLQDGVVTAKTQVGLE